MQNKIENKYSLNVWEDYYKNERKIHIKPKRGFFESYDIFLCDSILAKYLPYNDKEKKEIKICEIGCGGGKLIKKIADNFNYDPFGIEYSKEGVRQAKENGVNAILGDAFDEEFINKHKEEFDVVISYGFIEHIIPTQKAIKPHLDILKKGGILILQIPRLKKFNYLKAKIFRPDLLPLHNLPLMEQEVLSSLMKKENVIEFFCKNYGTLKLRIPLAKKDFKWYILKTICLLEYILNPLFRIIFKDKGFETKTFSPAVMFIGKKL